MVYDVSNACLGLLNGIVQVANMIELGQIRAGVVVGTESSRSLVETTIERLNSDTSLSRSDIKLAVASLTIGSGSAAIVLCDRELSRTGNRLLGRRRPGQHRLLPTSARAAATSRAATTCGPLMWTDSETLMREGIADGPRTPSPSSSTRSAGSADEIDKTFCHQVGRAHQKLLFESLGLDSSIDYSTLECSATPARWPCRPPRPDRHRKRPASPRTTGWRAGHRLGHQRPDAGRRLAKRAWSTRLAPPWRRRQAD